MADELLIERHGAVAVLHIDRPTRRNALGDALVAHMRGTFAQLDADAAVGAIVLTGRAPGFCAGSDLKELGTMSLDDMCAHEARTAAFCREIALLQTPVVAAVEGFALGGGFVLAASCDVVVTARSTRWNLPEVEIGWIPPWGIESLVNRVGTARARQLVWGGAPFQGEEALRLGLADHLADDGAALQRALDVAQGYARLPREAIASTKLYFATHGARNGEGGDVLASQLFKDNCRHATAQATLKKFGVKV
ncbi:MAG: enoyl-CoA hydratase/isomerase family protein [Proteobacteria bacterium]|jgi:enoyl-CoA hydratase/carnithine racemase|nr:enoyl-CoA hydratase/isomerase family protein [Ramlibacter sp.]MCA0212574.1 enoyl-CoA hydratase/isomerase family protein [Pseudomonadota bacterium]